jgi:PAS domain S-box-containing protein
MTNVDNSAAELAATSDENGGDLAVPVAGDDVGAFHQALLNGAPVTIYYMSAGGRICYANPAYRRVFGLAPEQGVDEWACGVHPDDRAALVQHWAEFSRNPRPIKIQFRTQEPSGAVRHMAETIVPATDIPGFIGTITDVTDLVTARDQLHKMEALHRSMFEQVPIGIAYSTRNGNLMSCNPAFSKVFGYTSSEIEGKPIRELLHPEDYDQSMEEFGRLWSGQINDYTLEKRYLKSDGSPVWVRVTVALVRDAAGEPICTVGFVEDISTRKYAEIALQQSLSLIEAIISHMPASLMACDATGAITLTNRFADEMLPLDSTPSEDGLGGSYPAALEVYAADGSTPVPRSERPLARALRGDTLNNDEYVLVGRNGARRTLLTSACRVLDPKGGCLGAVVVSQDITHLRETEAEVERIHRELLIASRHAGMAEVATNVLHNVGNVLNSVNVSAALVGECLKRSKAVGLGQVASLLTEHGDDLGQFITSDERGRLLPQYLTKLAAQLEADQQAALQELASLRANIEHIRDAVAMQQSYSKRFGVWESVDVHQLVEDSLRMNAGALTRHQVLLKREFAPVPSITLDKHKVLQILVNLVRNAKYACDESTRPDKQVTVRVDPLADGVSISVIDNGVGIKPENLPRLFQHGFTTRKAGHGFGLHSAALTAQELGGSLTAHSDGEGCGAKFVLVLPATPPGVSRE